VIITDAGSYSDVVFGLVTLLGFDYRPQLADLPDAKLWRINPAADYTGGWTPPPAAVSTWTGSRGTGRHPVGDRVDPHRRRLRLRRATRDLPRRKPHPAREAIAHHGQIFKTLHVLSFVDDPVHRREIKFMRNLQEDRHALARHVFHGRRGELHQAYREGMEDQLEALGLVLNCITLWNTVYLDAALNTLRAQGYPILEADVARLSPYARSHINVHGHCSFHLPDLGGARRPLRDPDADDVP
jgi:TnpA family transposase